MSEETKNAVETWRKGFHEELLTRDRSTPEKEFSWQLVSRFCDIIFDAYINDDVPLDDVLYSLATSLSTAAALSLQLVETSKTSKTILADMFEGVFAAHLARLLERTPDDPVNDGETVDPDAPVPEGGNNS
jgi:hypothetical protein